MSDNRPLQWSNHNARVYGICFVFLGLYGCGYRTIPPLFLPSVFVLATLMFFVGRECRRRDLGRGGDTKGETKEGQRSEIREKTF